MVKQLRRRQRRQGNRRQNQGRDKHISGGNNCKIKKNGAGGRVTSSREGNLSYCYYQIHLNIEFLGRLPRHIDYLKAIYDYQCVVHFYHISMEPNFEVKKFIHYLFLNFAKKSGGTGGLATNFSSKRFQSSGISSPQN